MPQTGSPLAKGELFVGVVYGAAAAARVESVAAATPGAIFAELPEEVKLEDECWLFGLFLLFLLTPFSSV
jgi:hypothetical protein